VTAALIMNRKWKAGRGARRAALGLHAERSTPCHEPRSCSSMSCEPQRFTHILQSATMRLRSRRLVPARQSALACAKKKATLWLTWHQRGAAEGTLQHYSKMYQTPLKTGFHSLKSQASWGKLMAARACCARPGCGFAAGLHLFLVRKRDPGIAGFGECSADVLVIDDQGVGGDLRSSTSSEPRVYAGGNAGQMPGCLPARPLHSGCTASVAALVAAAAPHAGTQRARKRKLALPQDGGSASPDHEPCIMSVLWACCARASGPLPDRALSSEHYSFAV